jgi:hypothetical protein
MARIITILALALRGNLAKLQPILFLDASQVHLHAVVRKQSLNSNPSFFWQYWWRPKKRITGPAALLVTPALPPEVVAFSETKNGLGIEHDISLLGERLVLNSL